MNINIANNLKKLRKQREITQEDLANFIGVSFQAVSKWERGEGYPDITILPVIANFFDVTLDELVGMNEIKNSVKRNDIMQKSRELMSVGKIGEVLSLLREGLKMFPNDYDILADLACYLDGFGETDEERKKNRDEAIKISDRILEFCIDSKIRSNVQANMCFTLWRNGEKERAIENAKKLPNIYKTSEMTLNSFLSGDEKVEACQNTIQELCWAFWSQTKQLAETEHYSYEEKIKLYEKAIGFYNLVYDSNDLIYAHIRVYWSYYLISQLCLENGEINKTISYIEKSAEHAIAYTLLPQKLEYKSLLVNMLKYNVIGTSTSSEKNTCWHMKNNLLGNVIFGPILKDARIKVVISDLEKYAN